MGREQREEGGVRWGGSRRKKVGRVRVRWGGGRVKGA